MPDTKAQNRANNLRRLNKAKAVWEAVYIYLLYFFLPQIFFLLFNGTQQPESRTVNILAATLGLSLLLFIFVRRAHKRDQNLVEQLQLFPRELPLSLLGVLALLGLSLNLATSAVLSLLPLPASLADAYRQSTASLLATDNIWFSILYLGIVAPIMEELFFRGLILDAVQRGFGQRAAVIAVAIAFALPHLDPVWIVNAALNGLVFGYYRVRLQNLTASIVMHMAFNLIALPVLLSQGTWFYRIFFDNVPAFVVTALLGGWSIWFCYQFIEKYRKGRVVS